MALPCPERNDCQICTYTPFVEVSMTVLPLNVPTRDRILDLAEELIQRYGYNGFSYDDIARSISIRKPSIHYHFATKAELGAAVAHRYTERFANTLQTITDTQKTAHSQLQAYIELFAQTYRRDRRLCLCGMLGAEAEALPQGMRGEIYQFFLINQEWLACVLRRGKEDGEFFCAESPESPESRALLFVASLEGAMVLGRGLEASNLVEEVGLALLADLTKR
ncbi:MAG: TetR/AcrR family transcriptional regulator [Leptolyngbyaceae bacterium]|nr:TetR/AcrR family transcriptional regulator [Leptolyngbyaceae bacterium]